MGSLTKRVTGREVIFDLKKLVEFPVARIRDLSQQLTKPMRAPSFDTVDSSIEESELKGAHDGESSADTWGNDDERIVRHHLVKRSSLYLPPHGESPIDPDKLSSRRTSIAYGDDGEEIVHEDVWKEGSVDAPESFPNEWKGRTVFYVADAHAPGEGSGGYADPIPRDVKIKVKKSTTYAADLVENVFDPCVVPKVPPIHPELTAEELERVKELVGPEPGSRLVGNIEHCLGDQYVRKPGSRPLGIHKDVWVNHVTPKDRLLLTKAYGTPSDPVMGVHTSSVSVAARKPLPQAVKAVEACTPVREGHWAATRMFGTSPEAIAMPCVEPMFVSRASCEKCPGIV